MHCLSLACYVISSKYFLYYAHTYSSHSKPATSEDEHRQAADNNKHWQ